ncbi:MAG: hypothetical protein LUG24_08055 [Clostridiales bacterium]|nr:hypothetical protein [Clostridiales bacterium]
MGNEVLFDINFLISPIIEEKLNNISSLAEKLDLLFSLLDFYHADFTHDEKMGIEYFYAEQSGSMDMQAVTSVTLTDDEKDFIKEYAACFSDFDGAKRLFNEICNEETKEKSIDEAS